jgi:hypothetical protein
MLIQTSLIKSFCMRIILEPYAIATDRCEHDITAEHIGPSQMPLAPPLSTL